VHTNRAIRAFVAAGAVAALLPARVGAELPLPVATATPASGPSPAASALPAAAPANANGLFGDLGGGRSALAKHGLSFNGRLVSEFAANATGGIPLGGNAVDRGTALSTEAAFGVDADVGTLTHSGAGIVHVLVTTRFGSSLSSTALGNLFSVQEIYGDGQTTRFTYLDYEQPLFKNKVNLLIGKINQQNDFIAGPSYWGGDLYCYYQNNNICGTPAGIPTNNGTTPVGSAGYDYYPSSMWGARLKLSPNENLYVEVAALQVNPIVNSNRGGAYFGFYGSTGTELPIEAGLTLRDRSGAPSGDIRLGGYFDTSNVFNFRSHETSFPGSTAPATLTSLPVTYARGRSGAYVQFDHMLDGASGPGRRGTALFAVAEYSDPNTALVSSYFDGGIVRHGTFANRPEDTIALGFATANYNPRLQRAERQLRASGYAVPYNGSESAIELNYGWQASKWLIVRPGVQYVLNPSGELTNLPAGIAVPKSALVFGLATDINF